ncbi:YbaK/EbsC family protein [Rhizobiales bacterium TNE-4]|nr:YbaK/EbsC family protein [Rhizobiales bacterium TNE-4]MBV1828841.1 YbaK/EbsC family protein [Rhizobiales bacterium TNE-4]
MSLESVRQFFATHAPDIEVLVTEARSATVAEAAAAHHASEAQIAKTLSFWQGDQVVLIVMGGMARLDNRKYKDRFATKAKMLNAEDVVQWTGHPIGGVCPFGLPHPLKIYCDESLKAFDEVIPAAGAINAAVRIAPLRMAELVGAEWIDVTQITAPADAGA